MKNRWRFSAFYCFRRAFSLYSAGGTGASPEIVFFKESENQNLFPGPLLRLIKIKQQLLHQIENRQVKDEKGNNDLITILNMLF
jgi:hypothetical protein